MSDTRHTPTPWYVTHSTDKHPIPDEANYLDIATIPSGCIHDHPGARLIAEIDRQDDEDDANAEYIVTACNSHKRLLTAIDRIQSLAYSADNANTQEDQTACIRKIFGVSQAVIAAISFIAANASSSPRTKGGAQ